MKLAFAEKLCCPVDKHTLNLKVFRTDSEDNLLEGVFSCPLCHRYYPVVYGVPIMTPDEYREKALEEPMLLKWGIQPDAENSTPFLLKENE
jgi:uncharacterized protein YbaR (Trm112 family)